MTGLELAVGWLGVYAWRKARRVAGRADAAVDRAIDAGMNQLHDLVTDKLAGDTAVAQLEAEAGQDTPEPVISERTKTRVLLALEEVHDADTDFATKLDALIEQLRQTTAAPAMVATNTGKAKATGSSVAVTGVVGGGINTTGR